MKIRLVVLTVVLIILGSGLYASKNGYLDLNKVNKSSETIPSDWKTYSNKDYGLSFRYPPEYEIITSKEAQDMNNQPYDQIIIKNQKTGKELVSIINGAFGGIPTKTISDTIISDESQVGKWVGRDIQGGLGKFFTYDFQTTGTFGNKYWSTRHSIDPRNERLLDQIFSTFILNKQILLN